MTPEKTWKDCIEPGDDLSRKARKIWRVLKTLPIPTLDLHLRERDSDFGLTPFLVKQRLRRLEKASEDFSKSVESAVKAYSAFWNNIYVRHNEDRGCAEIVGVRKEDPAEVQERIDKARQAQIREDQDLKRGVRRIMKRLIESDPKMAEGILTRVKKKAEK